MIIWHKTEKVVLGNWHGTKNKTEQQQSKVAEEKKRTKKKERKRSKKVVLLIKANEKDMEKKRDFPVLGI